MTDRSDTPAASAAPPPAARGPVPLPLAATLTDGVRPYRNPALSWLLTALILVPAIALGAGAGAWLGEQIDGGRGHLAKWGMLLCVALVSPLLFLVAHLRAPTMQRTLERDRRAPVLYLRSFAADAAQSLGSVFRRFDPHGAMAGRFTDEQDLVADLHKIGPVIAIGRPGERLPALGAARVYVGDDRWQRVVETLSDHAALIVLRMGLTDGLFWELQRVRRQPAPVVLLFEPHGQGADREAMYDTFRTRAAEFLPHPLPDDLGDARYIWFTDDWQPRPMSNLLDVLEAHGVKVKRPPPPPPKRTPLATARRFFFIILFTILGLIAALVAMVALIELFSD